MEPTIQIPRFPGRRKGQQPTHKQKARARRTLRARIARAAQQKNDSYRLKGIV